MYKTINPPEEVPIESWDLYLALGLTFLLPVVGIAVLPWRERQADEVCEAYLVLAKVIRNFFR